MNDSLMYFIQAGIWVKTSCSWITCSWVADMQLSVEKKKKFGVASQLKVQDVTPLLSKPQTSGASSSQDSVTSVIHVSHTVSWFQPELMAAVIRKGHVACMGEIKIVCDILVIEPKAPVPQASKYEWGNIHSFIHSFIPLACEEFHDSLPFSGASSIPLCYVLFPATLLHQLFFHPLSPHLAIYFLVYLSISLFPNSYIILFLEFYFRTFSVHVQTNVIYLTLLSLL